MKLKSQIWILPALFGLVLACSSNLAWAATDYILNRFDSADEVEGPPFPWIGGSATWDATVDANGSPTSGSMHVVASYSNPDPTAWQETQVGRDGAAWPYIDLSPYVNLEFDLKVDVPNSAPAGDGNWGQFKLVIQQWAWTDLATVDIVGNGWQHIVIPLSPATTLAHLIMDFHGKWGVVTSQDISYWLDNIKLTVPVQAQAPMPIGIRPAQAGVEIVGTLANANNSQRQTIRTVDGTYSWVGAANPVSYSFTSALPPDAIDCPEVDFLLVGNSDNPGGSAEWKEANVVYLQMSYDGNAANPAFNAQLMYKTNAPESNSQYWGQRPAAVWNTPKLVGTWTVTFEPGGNVTLAAPDGSTSSGVFPADAAAFFNTTVFPYIGFQPYGLQYPSVLFSHFGVTGVGTPLDDSFADLSNWNTHVATDYLLGVGVHPPGMLYELSWLGPATGYNLQQSADLTAPSWADAVAAGVTSPMAIGEQKKSFVPESALPSAGSGYWRLIKQ